MKLDLACGVHKQPGFHGVDIASIEGVDQVVDLTVYPWPFEDNSVDEAYCGHYFEHVPGRGRPRFMDELYRICKPGASITIVCPHWKSERSIQDFTHEWPPLCDQSFLYFNKQARDNAGLSHYGIGCDFDLSRSYDGNDDLVIYMKTRKSA